LFDVSISFRDRSLEVGYSTTEWSLMSLSSNPLRAISPELELHGVFRAGSQWPLTGTYSLSSQ